jgi:hypothetical protein
MNFQNVNILWNVHLIIKNLLILSFNLRGRFQKVCEKELKIIVSNLEILKRYLKNNCKSFAIYVGV